MSSISPRSLVTALIVIAGLGRAAAALEPAQFVAGWPLELPSGGQFFDIPLNAEIYRYGRSLDELAVLDSRGEPMPFYRVDVPSPVESERRTSLAVSPIYGPLDESTIAELSVATDGGRTDVTVTRPPPSEDSEVVAYIVDARSLEQRPMAIELEWQSLERPFLMGVSIEHSDNLTAWRPAGRGSVASLDIDGNRVTQARVPITGRDRGFYRITWDRQIADWQLERVVFIASELTETATFGTLELMPVEVPEEQRVEDALFFDAGGELPTTAVDLVIQDANRWASASIEWSNSLTGSWRRLGAARLFYNIDFQGQTFASEPLEIARAEARYWRVVFFPSPPAGRVDLELDYPDEKLRFAANGEAPYMLVGGTLQDDAGPDRTFAELMSTLERQSASIAEARVGARRVLGGPAALETPFAIAWRTVLLWTVLLAAAFGVAWMAFRLAREMFGKT